MKPTNTGTADLRKTMVNNPRMKIIIDNKMLADEQAVLKMMDVLELEIKTALDHVPACINLLAQHVHGEEPLDPRWKIVYGDEDFVPVVAYNATHGITDVMLIVHFDGFVRVKLSLSQEWWTKSDFDDLDVDMIKRVDVANRMAPKLGALMLEAGESMMAVSVSVGGINTFAVIDKEPRMLNDREWDTLQHDRGYSHCTCGMCGGGAGSGIDNLMANMFSRGGRFGGVLGGRS